MTDEARIGLIALGVASLFPGLVAIWKSATLRGEVFATLADRVDIAKSGLSERAIEYLRQMQKRIVEQLGNDDDFFDPDKALADPGPLTEWTRQFEGAIKARDRLDSWFAVLLAICKWAVVPALAYSVGVATATAVFASEWKARWAEISGLSLAGVALLVGIVITGMYHYLNVKISSAEILGRAPGSGTS